MKNKFNYIAMAALGCMLFVSCKEEIIELYDTGGDGVYFSYNNKEELNATVNCRSVEAETDGLSL